MLEVKDKWSEKYPNSMKSWEKYLRVFLENGMIPLDNNAAERSVKNFCVGKHSWHIIDSNNGAEASAILYSIAETAKANDLKTFEYFKYLLEQLLQHQDDAIADYIDEIMPWSETLPDYCKKTKQLTEAIQSRMASLYTVPVVYHLRSFVVFTW